jgi:hypothetical protein
MWTKGNVTIEVTKVTKPPHIDASNTFLSCNECSNKAIRNATRRQQDDNPETADLIHNQQPTRRRSTSLAR